MNPPHRYAYLHGFGSSSKAYKGTQLAQAFQAHTSHTLLQPDLNVPTFSTMTWTAILDSLDRLDRDTQTQHGPFTWRIIGSSMGGMLAALWAARNPTRVDRILLLCPGFDMVQRWPDIFGHQALQTWRERGAHDFPVYTSATPTLTPLHWGFYEDARTYPARPVTPCPTRILHGLHDTTCPLQASREYAQQHDHVTLCALDTDHSMASALSDIRSEIGDFFELQELKTKTR